MRPRPHPAHAQNEPPQLRSEDVLARPAWRARVGAGPGKMAAFERGPTLSVPRRIARAMRTPVVAGIAVFGVAVLVAIGIAVAGSLGGQLHGGSEAAASEHANPGSTAQLEGTEHPGDGGPATGTAGNLENLGSGTAGAGKASQPIFVHVVGAVRKAGVVELEPGARVTDALDAAGGTTAEAVLAGINLARTVIDGEQLVVPDAEALEAAAISDPAAEVGGPNQAGETSPGNAANGNPTMVNINSADSATLETLPRVGPALAGRIIEWREQNGGFVSVEQLLEVSGIGVKTFEGFRDRVMV